MLFERLASATTPESGPSLFIQAEQDDAGAALGRARKIAAAALSQTGESSRTTET